MNRQVTIKTDTGRIVGTVSKARGETNKVGYWEYYDSQENLVRKCLYLRGVCVKIVDYYESGSVKCEETYDLEGEKFGNWISYHENGLVQSECSYEDGLLTGPRKYYNSEGKEILSQNFIQGELLEEMCYYINTV
jgi:antitoxin component YwqK of YwqJK toxin-antitoxin module